MGHYDVAQVCLRGHVVNDSSRSYPAHNRDFCPKCGAKTIVACQHCSAAIPGDYHVENVFGASSMETAPAYCHKCGKPHPWTSEGIDAARALAEELEGLTDADRIMLNASLEDLVVDSPRTPVAVLRFKKIITKAKGPARELLSDVIAKVAVESAKAGLGM